MVSVISRNRSWLKPLVAMCLTVVAIPLVVVGFAGNVEGSAETLITDQANWFVDLNRFALSAHGSFKCEDCHGTMIENNRSHPDKTKPGDLLKTANRSFDYSRCQKCHKLSYQRYLEGEHAKALSKEMAESEAADDGVKIKTPAPTCGDCHSSHYDRSGLSRIAVGKRMISTCGRCHRVQTASYLENIHGRVGVHLENPAAAFCTDCHQAHTMTSLKEPTAALPACRRCHPAAETEFTNVVIHAAMDELATSKSPKHRSILWIHRIKLAVIAVVALSLIFFFGHSLLWLLREVHEKLRKH